MNISLYKLKVEGTCSNREGYFTDRMKLQQYLNDHVENICYSHQVPINILGPPRIVYVLFVKV